MNPAVAEPPPRLSVSTTLWDPRQQAFSSEAVFALTKHLGDVLIGLTDARREIEARGQDLGLLRNDVPVDLPANWAGSPGSPLHYLRVAEGFLYIAAEGGICLSAMPESPRSPNPPPDGRFCCEHDEAHGGPHCVPR